MTDYFEKIYLSLTGNWNVEAALCYFGKGNSNEGSEESKVILRYYVEPNDKRFRKSISTLTKNETSVQSYGFSAATQA